MNHKEVMEEDKRKKLPSNWEARKRQAEWILNNEEKRREVEEKVITFLYTYKYADKSQCSAVGIETGYRLDDQGVEIESQ
jgi:hypothetical protein